MKKRVYSSSDRAGIVQLDIKKQQKQQEHKHHSRCPIPKPSRPDSSTNKRPLNNCETSLEIKIKELKTPILNQMRLLIANLISSSDRILQYIQPQEHKHSINLYQKDRKKMLHYLNSLVVRPVDLGQVKARLNAGKTKPEIQDSNYTKSKHELPAQQQLGKQVETMKVQVQQEINHKRSKSSIAQLEKDMPVVKAKLHDLEKRNQANNQEQFSSFLKLCRKFKLEDKFKQNNPESSQQMGLLRAKRSKQNIKDQNLFKEVRNCKAQLQGFKNRLAYIQLLIFKCSQILNQSISWGNQADEVCQIEKTKIDQLAKALTQTAQQLNLQTVTPTDVVQKLKNQAKQQVLTLSQLRIKQVQLLREKQKALEDLRQPKMLPRKDQYLNQDQKVHIARLNSDIADLLQDLQKKDQLIKGLRQEKTHSHQDLKSLQEHIEQTQQKYRSLCIQFEETSEKLKNNESILQEKDEQIEQLRLQIKNKNKLIDDKNSLINEKSYTISQLQADKMQAESSKQSMQNQWLVSKKEYQSLLKQKERKIIKLQQQVAQLYRRCNQLRQDNQKSIVLKDFSEQKIANLQQRIEALQNQNEQLYSDMKQNQKMQEEIQEYNSTYQLLYKQLEQQCDNYRHELQQNHVKIHFYQEKVMQLAQLAAEQIKFMHSQHQQDIPAPILQLEVIEESAKEQDQSNEKQQEVMFNWNGQPRSDTKSDNSDKYSPFLLQNQIPSPKNSNHSKKSSPDLLKLANSQQLEIPGASTLSHYDILVVNENMDTIDTHKALYSKNNQQVKINDEKVMPVINQKFSQPSSNFTGNSQKLAQLLIKDIENQDNGQEGINEKIDDSKQQIQKQKKQLSDLQKLIGLIDSVSQSDGLTQKYCKKKVLQEDIDDYQVKKLNQKQKGQEFDIKTTKNTKQKKRHRSCQNNGNIYIRLKRQGSQTSKNRDRHQRSWSCFDKEL